MTYRLSISIVSLCLFAISFLFYLDRSIVETTCLHRHEVSAIISNLSTASLVKKKMYNEYNWLKFGI